MLRAEFSAKETPALLDLLLRLIPTDADRQFPILGNLSSVGYTVVRESQGQRLSESLQGIHAATGRCSKERGSDTSAGGKTSRQGPYFHLQMRTWRKES
jgi:hypothetical protein